MTTTNGQSAVEAVLRRDRFVVIGMLVSICVIAWAYVLFGIGMEMTAFEMTPDLPSVTPIPVPVGEAMNMPWPIWTPVHASLMLAMWWFMMIAMMLPSAAPTILLAAAINRRSQADRPPFGSTGLFLSGYLLAWFLFSAMAVIAQWTFDEFGLLSPMMASASVNLTGGLLIAAGLWQITPIKQACLRHCRSPVELLTRGRGRGAPGALFLGLTHGAYCLGCCWFLMGLLFVGGLMNLFWIVGLALFVLIEKVAARGVWFGRLAGAVMMAAGVATFLP